MTEAEVEAYRRKREITVEGRNVPKPVLPTSPPAGHGPPLSAINGGGGGAPSPPCHTSPPVLPTPPRPVTVPLHPPPYCLRQGKGGREREREREKKKRGRGPSEALPSHGSQTAPIYWFGPAGVPAGSPCPSLGHQPPPMLGRRLVGSGWPPTGRPCHCHKEVAGGRRNRGRRRKEKKEGRRKEEKKKERKGRWSSSAVGTGPVTGSQTSPGRGQRRP